MKLYLVQHAKAASKEQDPERPITEEGLRETQKITSFIKPLDLSVDYLWHSGKLRAEQTARILAEAIKINKAYSEKDRLGPNDDVAILADELTGTNQDTMIVGHLPFLGKLASLLLVSFEPAGIVAFKNSGITALSRTDPDQWRIDWIITPDLLT